MEGEKIGGKQTENISQAGSVAWRYHISPQNKSQELKISIWSLVKVTEITNRSTRAGKGKNRIWIYV